MNRGPRFGVPLAKLGPSLIVVASMAWGCGSDDDISDSKDDAGLGGSSAGGDGGSAGGGSGGSAAAASGGIAGSGAVAGAGAGGAGGVAVDGGAGAGAAPDASATDSGTEGGLALDAAPETGPTVVCDPPQGDAAGGAKLCLIFSPEEVDLIPTNPALDGLGQLYIAVYDTPSPEASTVPLVEIAPHPSADSIYDLPQVDISGLPETVWVRTLFVDNPGWNGSNFFPGTFLGGYNLNSGLRPLPSLRQIDLTAGEGTVVDQLLTAIRGFQVDVALSPTDPPTPEDDGQGPLSVGVFTQRAAAGALIYGGVLAPCVDITSGPVVDLIGLFYKIYPGAVDFYFGAQLNDFNAPGIIAPGSLVSADPDGLLPATQVATVDKEYFIDAGSVYLTTVYEPGSGAAPYSCPGLDPPDAGTSDGGPADAATD